MDSSRQRRPTPLAVAAANRRPRSQRMLVAMAMLAAGCSGADHDAVADAGHDAGEAPEYLTELSTERDFDRLAAASDVHGGEVVKYLVRVSGAAMVPGLPEACYFQNMHVYPWHVQFLQTFPEQRGLTYDGYRALVLRGATRRLFGGALQRWPEALHPQTQRRGVFSFSLYSDPGGAGVDRIAELHAQLEQCAPFARERLVFVPDTPDQQALIEREAEALRTRGVSALAPDELLSSSPTAARAADRIGDRDARPGPWG